MTSARDSFLAALLRGLGEEGRRWDVKKTPAGRDWIVLRSAPGVGAATMLTPTAKANMASPSMAKWAGGWARTMPTPRPCSGLRSRGVNQTELERALLPSPMAGTNRKSRKAMTASTDNGRRSGGGNSSPPGLEQVVEIMAGQWPKEMPQFDQLPPATRNLVAAYLPTPLAISGNQDEATHARNARPLSEQAYARGITGTAALLTLVEWMMGYPPRWLLDAASAVPVSPHMATPSSRPSPSRSRGRSMQSKGDE